MAIPEPADDFESQRKPFALLRGLQQDLASVGIVTDTLSMGMSADLEAAVAEGATIVRIGTAIFGERPAQGASVTDRPCGWSGPRPSAARRSPRSPSSRSAARRCSSG